MGNTILASYQTIISIPLGIVERTQWHSPNPLRFSVELTVTWCAADCSPSIPRPLRRSFVATGPGK